MTRTLTVLFGTRFLRAAAFGVATVLVAIHLERLGVDPRLIGLTLTLGVLSASLFGLGAAWLAARVGRRLSLAVSGALMALCGLDLAFATQSWILVLAGATGMLGIAGADVGAFSSVEQAALAQVIPQQHHAIVFGRYALAGGLGFAAGSFAALVGVTLPATHWLFIGYAVVGVLSAGAALLLDDIESPAPGRSAKRAALPRSIYELAALFALDSFAGGLVVQGFIVYWLHVRFGVDAQTLGPAVAFMSLAQAASFEVSGRLAQRFGSIRTMVFTHLPSNVLLIAVPLCPTLTAALTVLVMRFAIAQMDVPARQALIASLAPPEARDRAAALAAGARGIAQTPGPTLAGAAVQVGALAAPFFLAGILKIVYDVVLYVRHRDLR
ncbi:MAG TPA: MFS transporter [Candidatus Tumulicola sp.]|nr:MFS transporter [Candidatus Tumulicola sp.]